MLLSHIKGRLYLINLHFLMLLGVIFHFSISCFSKKLQQVKNFKRVGPLLRDGRKRFLFSTSEVCFISYNLLAESNFSKIKVRDSLFSMDRQFLGHSLSCVLNRCLFTGKSSSVYAQFRVSRITFRKIADFGLLAGVRRAA